MRTIPVVTSFVDGDRVPVQVRNLQKSENLFEAAEVAERCGDFATRDQLLNKAIATLDNVPHRRQHSVTAA